MASTYSNSGIELIANGEQSGTWGDTTNVNLQIIDRLTNGVGSISLSGTTHTLTTSDGSLSDGQYRVLVFGGSPSGTNTVTISPNDATHLYFVRNASGQSVVLTQGSGGNVTIANGDTKVVYTDGAGAGAAVVDITNDFAMGSVSITGGVISGITSLGVSGNISVTGTVDGRDIATDGTKLDGIEAGADVTDAANVGTALGTGSAAAGEVLSWTGSTFDWVAGGITYVRKTANYTASANEGIIADTSGGTWTLTLPSSPSVGTTVIVVDGASWATTNLTIGRNGSTIEGDAADMTMNIGGVAVQFTYDGTTWQIYAQVGVTGDAVTLTGTQTLTNKTLTSPTVNSPSITNPSFTGTPVEDVYALSGTSAALEPDNGSVQTHTLSGNTTYTDAFSSGQAITLMIDDGTAYTVTWPTMTWVNNAGAAPTLATSGYTVVALWKVSTTLYGALVGDGS